MKLYSALTRRGQLARLRRLAESVLPQYPLVSPRLTVIRQGFNTTFCVDAEDGAREQTREQTEEQTSSVREDPYAANRYLLRVHRPGWYVALGSTGAVVQSELLWLSALRHDTALVIPEPVLTKAAAYTVAGSDEGVSDPRVCSLLRWIKGRSFARSPKPIHLHLVGALTAQLHNHAAAWTIPAGFVRPEWHWDAFFGKEITFTHLRAPELWALVPSPYRAVLESAALALQPVIRELGRGPEVWGLIHADLHLDNMLFAAGEARPIDFDDSGFGYWIYDIAVALWELRLHAQWPTLRQAFFDGYAQHRPIPHEQLPYLDTFIAAREAFIGLGIAATTQEIPAYLVYLDEDMRRVAETIRAIQG